MNKSSPSSLVSGRTLGVSVETLEKRALLSFSFQFDYRYDATGFFSDPAKRTVLESAGQLLSQRIADTFSAVVPSGSNTWSVNLRNPTTGDTTSIVNPVVGQDQLIVYVGARDLDGSTLGQGGPNGWSASGTTEWTKLVRGRGQAGATASPRTDFAPKTGSISFDANTNWFFGTTTAGLGTTQTDFYSVAAHELGHVLGIGAGSETWPALASGGFFNGPKAKAVYGGPVPLMADGVHFKDNITSGGQETALDPTLKRGTRKLYTPLDYAALDDVGYDITLAGSVAGSVFVDQDNDGYRDGGEAGVSGVRVYIDADKDNIFDANETSVVTDASGRYLITNLSSGTYRVAEVVPDKYVAAKPAGAYRSVSVTAGQQRNSQDFSIAVNNAPGRITGSLFNDLDSDGFKDNGEGALSGWRVFADTDRDGVYDSGEALAVTNQYGAYTLTLPPGDYRIAAESKGGFRRSGPSSGYHDVTLEPGATVSPRSFYFTQKVLLSGRVFKDLDGDGLRDSNEAGLSGWRVFLDADGDGVWDAAEVSALTSGTGEWSIKNQAAGSFVVRVVQQPKYALRTPTGGRYSVTLTNGGLRTNLLFAEQPTV